MQSNKTPPKQPKPNNIKLTLMLILLPILVIALMIVFWVIFQENRKHPDTSELPSQTSVQQSIDQLIKDLG